MDAQLETIGARCHFCSRQDFLPFSCPHCSHTFCLSHASESAHTCTQKTVPSPTNHKSGSAGPSLRQLQAEHLARRVQPDRRNDLKAQMQQQAPSRAAAVEALERIKSITSGFMIRGKSSTIGKAQVQLSKLKREAKGDAKIPLNKRLHFFISRSTTTTSTTSSQHVPIPFFVDREWTNGRVLDALARECGLVNENARTRDESRRLHLFYEGLILEPSQQFGTLVKEAGTVVVFRGITPVT